MKISIVIPTHNRKESLFRLLRSIELQEIKKSDVEVLVVFNLPNSTLKNEVHERFRKSINCTVLVSGRLGVNYARHMGGNHALGKILVYLDDDCRLSDPKYLEKLLDLHKAHPEAAAIGGPYSLPAGAGSIERVYHQISLSWLENSVFDAPWTRNLVGGNVSYKRFVFDRGLNFNSKIRFGGAETDFHMRLQKHGLRLLYSPSLVVEHWLEMSRFQFIRKGFLQGVGFETRVMKGLQIPNATKANPLHTPIWSPAEKKLVTLYDYAFQKGRLWAQNTRNKNSRRRNIKNFASASLREDLQYLNHFWQRIPFLTGTGSTK
ncbi:MAG: glycosyltransferase family 2 protein [Bdellovibrionaceae bacterium]|nr:glycosyltransferase family 2 protein [Pseudobdellovibrionaceae bacterium]